MLGQFKNLTQNVSYRILVRLVLDISPGGDFEPGSQINIYNVNKQDIGDFFIDNVQQLNDQNAEGAVAPTYSSTAAAGFR